MIDATLEELCDVVRTKNAGPYLFALDLIFSDPAVYARVKSEELLTSDIIAAAFNIPREQIVGFEFYDDVAAIKTAIRRPRVSGAPGDGDCYAMNQEVPALGIRIKSRIGDSR